MIQASNRVVWRWEERDFGFRFRSGEGRHEKEYYQAARAGEFYIVPKGKRKLPSARANQLAKSAHAPVSPRVVPLPWLNYDQSWDWIATGNGIVFNYAGCLDPEEIQRREDEGVARAMEHITALAERTEPVPITTMLIRQLHRELMGTIYPFAGEWRCVALSRSNGPTWPLPPIGIDPFMQDLENNVLNRSPMISDNDDRVFAFASELMNELIAIHPFREGNGRTAFILANLILMQNGLLPLDVYDRRRDESRYYAACEAGRQHKSYGPLAALLNEWSDAAVARWEATHG